MIIRVTVLLLLIIYFTAGFLDGQSANIYNWNTQKDNWATAGSAAFFGTSLYLLINSKAPTLTELQNLDRSSINNFDKSALDNYNLSVKPYSDILLFGSVALPFVHYSSKKGRIEGWVLTGIILQSYFVSDGLTNILKSEIGRYRPFTYNNAVSQDKKLSKDAKFSFVSGHTSNSALFSFLAAKFFNDLYPESPYKSLVWGIGIVLPMSTAYLRYEAGSHFPTDLIGGYLIGASIGILIPHLHKNRRDDLTINLIPVANGLTINLNKSF